VLIRHDITVQTQGLNIRVYSNYLVQRAQSYDDTHVDYVRSGTGRMKNLSIDKGLLRETESIQAQIKALLKCNVRIRPISLSTAKLT